MRRYGPALALCAATLLAAACGGVKAQALLPDSQPLTIPAAPSHIVVPAAPEPPPAPVVETPTPQVTPPATSGNGAGRTRQDPPASRPAAQPAAPPSTTPQTPAPSTPTPLEAAPNQGELEQRARALVSTAEKTMDKIDYKALSADGRTQYDTAKRFLKQADDALRVKNVVYAWQLADKANTIATLLK